MARLVSRIQALRSKYVVPPTGRSTKKKGRGRGHASVPRTKLQHLSYAQFLRTPYWKHLRLQALEDANFRCRRCGTAGRVNAFPGPQKLRGRETPADVHVLCPSCRRQQIAGWTKLRRKGRLNQRPI